MIMLIVDVILCAYYHYQNSYHLIVPIIVISVIFLLGCRGALCLMLWIDVVAAVGCCSCARSDSQLKNMNFLWLIR